jgi:hypothetical protein
MQPVDLLFGLLPMGTLLVAGSQGLGNRRHKWLVMTVFEAGWVRRKEFRETHASDIDALCWQERRMSTSPSDPPMPARCCGHARIFGN